MKTVPVPARYTEPHYSARLCRAQFQYIAKHHDKKIFHELCHELGMPLDYILKDENWVSDSFFREFVERLKVVTGDPDISRKTGRATISPDAISPVEFAVNQTLLFPALFFLGMPLQYRRYNNVNSFDLQSWRPGYFKYVSKPLGKTIPHEDVCKSTVGMLEGLEQFFGLDELKVIHTHCIHRGAESCEFEVRYRARTFYKNRIQSALLFATFGAAGLLLFRSHSDRWTRVALPWLFSVAYLVTGAFYFVMRRYFGVLKYIHQYNDQSRSRAAELYENFKRLDRKYHESTLLRGLSLKLSETVNTKELLQSCLEELERRFGYSRSMIMLLNAEGNRIYVAEARGFQKEVDLIYTLAINYPADQENPQLFANILGRGQTTAIFDIEPFRKDLRPANQLLLDSFNANSLVVSPIQDSDQKYGLLMIGSIGDDRRLSEDDQQMIENITRLLSLSFQTARNFERETSLRALFQKYVPALVLEGISSLSPAGGHLAPHGNIITSVFFDLRDFTSRCENLAPEKVVEMLNLYTDFITARVASAGGIIDKFVGDGIDAFFPAETRRRTMHARAAVLSAVCVLADLPELEKVFQERGFGPACVGVGIHTGPATVGTMGCDRKLDYTAVGDTVNIASRLQDLSKEFRDRTASSFSGIIVLSESTYRRAQLSIEAQEIGEVPIRGRHKRELLHFIDAAMAMRWMSETGRDYRQLTEVLALEEDRVTALIKVRRQRQLAGALPADGDETLEVAS